MPSGGGAVEAQISIRRVSTSGPLSHRLFLGWPTIRSELVSGHNGHCATKWQVSSFRDAYILFLTMPGSVASELRTSQTVRRTRQIRAAEARKLMKYPIEAAERLTPLNRHILKAYGET